MRYVEQYANEEWGNAIISGGIPYGADNAVSAVTFFMNFAPTEEIDIEVSHLYALGGRDTYMPVLCVISHLQNIGNPSKI